MEQFQKIMVVIFSAGIISQYQTHTGKKEFTIIYYLYMLLLLETYYYIYSALRVCSHVGTAMLLAIVAVLGSLSSFIHCSFHSFSG